MNTLWLALLAGVLAAESVPGYGDDVRVAVGVVALGGGTLTVLAALAGLV